VSDDTPGAAVIDLGDELERISKPLAADPQAMEVSVVAAAGCPSSGDHGGAVTGHDESGDDGCSRRSGRFDLSARSLPWAGADHQGEFGDQTVIAG
jgi:hypothetical protein